MGAKAAKIALNGMVPDLILNASGVAKQVIPDTSVFIQKELGLEGIPSFSIHATCLSFLVAFHTAATFISQGNYKKILIISSTSNGSIFLGGGGNNFGNLFKFFRNLSHRNLARDFSLG